MIAQTTIWDSGSPPTNGQLLTVIDAATGKVGGTDSGGGGGGSVTPEVKTADFTAVSGHSYQVDTTSNSVTVTLPSSPTVGMIIEVEDATMYWATNNVIVTADRDINGVESNFTANVSGDKIGICYISDAYGWSIK